MPLERTFDRYSMRIPILSLLGNIPQSRQSRKKMPNIQSHKSKVFGFTETFIKATRKRPGRGGKFQCDPCRIRRNGTSPIISSMRPQRASHRILGSNQKHYEAKKATWWWRVLWWRRCGSAHNDGVRRSIVLFTWVLVYYSNYSLNQNTNTPSTSTSST